MYTHAYPCIYIYIYIDLCLCISMNIEVLGERLADPIHQWFDVVVDVVVASWCRV